MYTDSIKVVQQGKYETTTWPSRAQDICPTYLSNEYPHGEFGLVAIFQARDNPVQIMVAI